MKTILTFTIATGLAIGTTHIAQARGFGGTHPEGGASSEEHHSSSNQMHSTGNENEHHASGNESSEYHPSNTQQEGYHAGSPEQAGSHPTGTPTEGNVAAQQSKNPQATGAQGAAAGAAVSNRNSPQMTGAQGAAMGAAASNRNQPAYSGAQGAAAGAAVANRNQPAYSGAQGAVAGAAVANNNNNASQMYAADGAVAGYAAAGGGTGGSYTTASAQGLQATGPVALPTDGGFGAQAANQSASQYSSNHVTQRVDDNSLAAQGSNVRNSYNGAGTFDKNWYGAHPDAWHAAGWGAGEMWNTANWGAITPVLGITVQPIPYNYGTDITFQGNQVLNGGQPVGTCDQYYQQASQLALSAPPSNPQSSDWVPLGVFALVRSDQSSPQYVMQLALNKSGALAGNYCDLLSNSIFPIRGAVDTTTQRIAWTVGNNKSTVGETGLYNLTKAEGPVLIHMGPDKTQQWTLVRLKQPE